MIDISIHFLRNAFITIFSVEIEFRGIIYSEYKRSVFESKCFFAAWKNCRLVKHQTEESVFYHTTFPNTEGKLKIRRVTEHF